MMKKYGLAILFLMVLIGLVFSASADSVVTGRVEIGNARDVVINAQSNVLAVQDYAAGKYRLMKADGTAVTDHIYTSVNAIGCGPYFKVSTGTGCVGLVDGAGNVVVPEKYMVIDYFSEKWQAGVNVLECTSENYDYKSYASGKFFMIDSVDMYFNGQIAGTLTRSEYTNNAQAMGNYIRMRNRDGAYQYYDQALVKSAYENRYGSEYDYNYETRQIIHSGSGQQAFTAGCTLTADDVAVAYYELNGEILDLQGNVVFKTPYMVSKIQNNRISVRDTNTSLMGMLDLQGNTVIPVQYKYINDMSLIEGDNAYGFYMVEKDGKAGYVDLKGNCAMSQYNSDVVRAGNLYGYVMDLNGNYIVITATAGELGETYSSIYDMHSSTCPVFAVENAEGAAAILDLNGNQVVPFTAEITSSSNVSASYDGTVVCYRKGSYSDMTFVVLTLEHTYDSVGAAKKEDVQAQEWSCPSCSAICNGNFCSNCGTARP